MNGAGLLAIFEKDVRIVRLHLNVHWTPAGALTVSVILVLALVIGWIAAFWTGWLLGVLLGLLLLALGLVGAGALYQRLADQRARTRHHPPGRLVDVGGFRLHLHTLGDARDAPTLVFESASGVASPEWGWIAPEVACFTHLVLYDRAGQGWSDEPPVPVDALQSVRALHAALEQARIRPPYLLVGHALGGLLSQVFAQSYPDEVAGLLLVDPHPVPVETALPPGGATRQARAGWWLLLAARLGLLRLSGLADQVAGCLPEVQAQQAVAFLNSTRTTRGWRAETRLARTVILPEPPLFLADTPLLVLSAELPDSFVGAHERAEYTRRHVQLAQASRRGAQRVLPATEHYSIVLDPDHARLIVVAIRDMVDDIRKG